MSGMELRVSATAAERYAAQRAAEWLADKRLLKWARKQVNADLRKWRQAARDGNPDAADLIADCKAKLRLLNWAENWSRVREPDYDGSDDQRILAELQSNFTIVIAPVRYLAQAWRGRDGWRPEWERD